MDLETIKTAVASKSARHIFKLKNHSPRILFVAGAVGVIGTVVLACRATLQVGDKIEQIEKGVDHFSELAGTEVMARDEATKEISKVKLRGALSIGVLYLPAIGLGLASIGALTGSHVILTNRNTTLVAGLAAVDRAYREYRDRVVKEYGEDADRKLAYDVKPVSVDEKMADGTTKTTTATAPAKGLGGSPYAVMFDETSRFFSKEPGRNAETLQMKQSQANDRLRLQGHLFLNELYDFIGLPRTPVGARVGWIYYRDNDPDDKKYGDNFVDFKLWGGDPEWVEGFMNGFVGDNGRPVSSYNQPYAIIDPNVAGEIWDRI